MDLETAVKKFEAANPYRKVVGYWETKEGFVLLSDSNGSIGTALFLVTSDKVEAVTPMRAKINPGKMKFYVNQ